MPTTAEVLSAVASNALAAALAGDDEALSIYRDLLDDPDAIDELAESLDEEDFDEDFDEGDGYFHGPVAPGPDWIEAPPGPKGGKRWQPGKKTQQDAPDAQGGFKAWFGGSKVADESGKPRVAYHGSVKDFNTFDPDKGLTTTDKIGSWFAMDPKFAEARLRHRNVGIAGGAAQGALPEGSSIMPTYLSIKKPLELSNRQELDTFLDQNIVMPEKLLNTYKPAIIARWKDNADPDDERDQKKLQDRIASFDRYHDDPKSRQLINNMAQALAEHAGKEEPFVHLARAALHEYDGVHIADDKGHGEAWVALKPTQIKSTANRGTFDPSDSHISHDEGDGYFHGPVAPGADWIEAPPGPKGGKRWQPNKKTQQDAPDAQGGFKAKIKAAIAELHPLSILSRISQAAKAAAHPVETAKRIGGAVKAKFESLNERYGAAGATAIAGAYAAYYTVAALNPVLFTVPVPLTATILGSARCIRYGLLKARGKAVEFAEADMIEAARQFIAELSEEAGEEPPEIDDDTLSAILDHLKEQAEQEQEEDAEAEPFRGDYTTGWGRKLSERYPQ